MNIAQVTLWDSMGNKCSVEMFCIGVNVFEVYFHRFNSDIPTRKVGSIGECNNAVDCWISARKSEGFQEQLPSYNPNGTREAA